jgi:transcriptional regulator with XRE-family HTH domain
MPTTGELIKRAREAAGMTQRDVAQTLDTYVQTVSTWERDFVDVRLSTIYELAELFGVPASSLVGDKYSRPKARASAAKGGQQKKQKKKPG